MSRKKYKINPPPKDEGDPPLLRVVYAIDVGASDPLKAAEIRSFQTEINKKGSILYGLV
jgi:hypothetical protein